MTEQFEKKRGRAEHFKDLAEQITDQQVASALIEKASKLEREAEKVEEHPQTDE